MLKMVGVIGSGDADPRTLAVAEEVGATIARAGHGLVCGGLGGVMEAACKGARSVLGDERGRVLGILPGSDRAAANPWVDIVVPSGLGYARNLLVVLTADVVVAVGGESGTLSELAHAWQLGRPICAMAAAGGWGGRLAGEHIDDKRDGVIHRAESAAELATWLRETLDARR